MTNIHPDIVCFGEVLWDILPEGAVPGGAPMNVAYHLKKLGITPALITQIGKDDYGTRLLNMLARHGLDTNSVQIHPHLPTGLVYATVQANKEVQYDIVFPSAWDEISYRKDFTELVNHATYFVFGSLAARHITTQQTLFQLLDSPATKVLDINLRPPHYNKALLERLLISADILKMNDHELHLITGWYADTTDTKEKMQFISDHFNIETVIVTMGSDGAAAWQNGKYFFHNSYAVKVADTIGSGDSFLAGYLSQILSGKSVEQALEFSCGLGALIASKRGACPQYEMEEIEKLLNSSINTHHQPNN